jgi:hypothetical protein
MGEIFLYYKRPDPMTWVYMSSFLTIALFFVFRRFWSIRNLDIALLILLAPGLLAVYEGYRRDLMQTEAIANENVEPLNDQEAAGEEDARDASERWSPTETGRLPSHVKQQQTLVQTTTAEAGPSIEREAMDRDQSIRIADGYVSKDIQRFGFIYLFVIEAIILIRLMLDPLMVRRPMLDPNLTTGGLNFIGIWLFIFMMANVVTSTPRVQVTQGPSLGPGYTMMNLLPAIPTRQVSDNPGGVSPPTNAELTPSQARLAQIAKALAILAHLAICTGIVLIANRHFSNLRAGVGCATLYLMLPYTAQMTGRLDHFLPVALLLWAILSYRRPFIAGMFLGLAGGLVYYPLFLLPLWVSFYWRRGVRWFSIGVIAMLVLLMIALPFYDSASLTEHLRRMYGLFQPNRDPSELGGLWGLGWYPIWRLPVIVAYVILSAFFAIWPAQKNLATLVSGSAALMVAAQFWHGFGGGLYVGWFLPLFLLVIFRPNLQDRVATKVVAVRGKLAKQDVSQPEPEPA